MATIRSAGFDEEEQPNGRTALNPGKKYILGIGIDDYTNREWPKLANAVRDMDEVVRVLTNRYDFHHSTVLRNGDATRDRIEEELYRFANEKELGPDDSLLIYYSGHGYLDDNKRGYWVPVGAQKGKIASYLPNSRIREIISDMKGRHVLLISDSCYSGSLFARGRGGGGDELVALDYERRISRWAFCSGRDDEKVSDGTGAHSPFAQALLQELSLNDKGKIHLSRIAERVTAITRNNYAQLPDFGPLQDTGDLGGQFVFTLKGYVAKDEPTVVVEEPIRGDEEPPTTPPTTLPVSSADTNIDMLRRQIIDLIAEGRTLEGIKKLIALEDKQYEEMRSSAVLLSGRWKQLERENMSGALDPRELTTQQNKIRNALMALIDDLKP